MKMDLCFSLSPRNYDYQCLILEQELLVYMGKECLKVGNMVYQEGITGVDVKNQCVMLGIHTPFNIFFLLAELRMSSFSVRTIPSTLLSANPTP